MGRTYFSGPVDSGNGFNSSGGTSSLGAIASTSIINSGSLLTQLGIVSGSGATVQLTAAQSGATILMDRAAGIVFTLPNVGAGYYYDFLVTTSVTSNSYKVITFTPASQFIIGSILMIDTDNTNTLSAFIGDGSTHVAVTQAAASSNATGGLKGSVLRFTSYASGLWIVSGVVQHAGNVATPFATS